MTAAPVAGDNSLQRKQLAVDTALGMLVLIIVGTAITANVGGVGLPGVAAYAFGALFGALMLLRRRWPVATLLATAAGLLAYYMLSFPPIGLAPPVAAALYSAAEQGKLRWAAGTAVTLLAVSTAFRINEGDDLSYLLGFEFIGSAGLMTSVVLLGDSVRARRGWRTELENQAHAAALEQEREAARQVEHERLRIARELHDLLAHTVAVIALHVDVARESLPDDLATAQRSLAKARSACAEISTELRATLRALRTGDDDTPVAGLRQLDSLLDTVRAAGLEVELSTTGEAAPLPAIADTTSYRILQESLSNVLRHAGARTVIIELAYGSGMLRIRIRDDGNGAEPAEQCGWGLIGMRERLTLLGGMLRTHAQPGTGFTVEADIPFQEPA